LTPDARPFRSLDEGGDQLPQAVHEQLLVAIGVGRGEVDDLVERVAGALGGGVCELVARRLREARRARLDDPLGGEPVVGGQRGLPSRHRTRPDPPADSSLPGTT